MNRDFGLDFEMFMPIPGHGSTLSELKMPQFPDLGKLFEQTFTVSDTSDVVKVINLFDLERSDVDVTQDGDLVTVKGEFSSDIDATRVYEQFTIPNGLEIKRVHFVKRGEGMNRLVFVFDSISEENE